MGYDGTLTFDTKIDSSGFQSGVDKISSLAGNAMKATTAVIGGAASAIAGVGTAAVNVGTTFEASMSNVAAISGATGKDLESLTAKAEEMGAKTKFSASESADAFSYMAMAGWKTGDMLDGIEGIMNLAAASGEDLATTSDIVTDALTAFGMSAEESGHFADVLAATSSNANTNVSMLGESFKYVAPVAGSLGMSAEDTSLALGLMANSGIKASQAGTSLRSLLTRMVKPTKQSAEALEKLGLSIKDDNGNVKDLNTVMLEMREAFSHCTDAEKGQYAALLAGQEGMSGLLAIVNASEDDYNKLTDAIANSTDELTGYSAAAEMAETMNDNLQGQVTILKSSLEGFGIKIYDELENPCKEVVKTAQEMVTELSDAFSQGGFEGLVDKAGDVLARIITKGAEKAPELITLAVTLCGSFINSLLENKDKVAEAGVTLLTSLISGILEFSGDFWSGGVELFTALLAGLAENAPELVTKAQEALTQFGQSLADNAPSIAKSATKILIELGKGFVESLPELLKIGKQIIEGIIQGISEESPTLGAFLSGVFDGLQTTLGPALDVLKSVFQTLASALKDIDPETAKKIGEAVGKIAGALLMFKGAKGIASIITSAISPIGTLGSNLISFGKDAAPTIINETLPALSNTFSSFGSTIGSLASGASSGIAAFGSTIMTGLAGVVSAIGVGPLIAIGAAIAAIIAIICNWDTVKAFFTETLPNWWNETAWPAITGFFESAGQWLSELPGKVLEFFMGVIEKLGEWASSVGEWLGENIPLLIESVVQFFSELPYKIGYAIGFVLGTLGEWALSVGEWITTEVPQIIESIVTFFAELPGKIWEWLCGVVEKIGEWGGNILSWITENVPKMIDDIVTFFSELPGKIWEWLQQAIDKIVEWGQTTLDDAKQAASDTLDGIVEFFSQLPGKIWEWLNDTIGKVQEFGSDLLEKGQEAAQDFFDGIVEIVSELPGKMMEIGGNIVDGVWQGIQNAYTSFWNNVHGFFSGIVDGVKAGLEIGSPSKVFAREVGQWIPPGVGKGVDKAMPKLIRDTKGQMEDYARQMTAAVNRETVKVKLDMGTNESYKAQKDNETAFIGRESNVNISGEIHTHVELDGEEIGNSTTPIVDRNFARLDQHKKRGG